MVGAQQIKTGLNLKEFLIIFLEGGPKRGILKADDRCLGQLRSRKIVKLLVNSGYEAEDK